MKDPVSLILICCGLVATCRAVISLNSRSLWFRTCPSQPVFRTSGVGNVPARSRALLHSSSGSAQGGGDEMSGINAGIAEVEKQIRQVEEQVQQAAENAANAADKEDRDYWRKKEEDLRQEKRLLLEKEKDLRQEKKDLRKKERLLLEKEKDLRQEKMLLLKAQIASTTKAEAGQIVDYAQLLEGAKPLELTQNSPEGESRCFGVGTKPKWGLMERDFAKDEIDRLVAKINDGRFETNFESNRNLMPIGMCSGSPGIGKTTLLEYSAEWIARCETVQNLEKEEGQEHRVLVVPVNYNGGDSLDGLPPTSDFVRLSREIPQEAFAWRVARSLVDPKMWLEEFLERNYRPGLRIALRPLLREAVRVRKPSALVLLIDEIGKFRGGKPEWEDKSFESAVDSVLQSASIAVQSMNPTCLAVLVCSSLSPSTRVYMETRSGRPVRSIDVGFISHEKMIQLAEMELSAESSKEGQKPHLHPRVTELLLMTQGHPRTLFDYVLPTLASKKDILAGDTSQREEMVKRTVSQLRGKIKREVVMDLGAMSVDELRLLLIYQVAPPERCVTLIADGVLRQNQVEFGKNLVVFWSIPFFWLWQATEKKLKGRIEWLDCLKRACDYYLYCEGPTDVSVEGAGAGGAAFQAVTVNYLAAVCTAIASESKGKRRLVPLQSLLGTGAEYLGDQNPLNGKTEVRLPCTYNELRWTLQDFVESEDEVKSSFIVPQNPNEFGVDATIPVELKNGRKIILVLQIKWVDDFTPKTRGRMVEKAGKVVKKLREENYAAIPVFIVNRVSGEHHGYQQTWAKPSDSEIWIHGQGAVVAMMTLLGVTGRWNKKMLQISETC